MEQYQKIWDKIKYQLQMTLDDDVYNEHFFGISNVFKVINNTIYLISPNSFIKSKIESFYLNRLNAMLNEYLPEKHLFKIITKEQAAEEIAKTSSYEINVPEPDLESKYKTGLNNSYTFDNFVVGSSNRLAYTSAMKVADQPGVVANPLYIFGDVGLGKTHLMQCVGNYIIENDVNKKVLYVKTDQFIEDYAKAAQKKAFDDFSKKYENVDILLVDDIQFLSGKTQSQLEFFKIFEKLKESNKQIVITSDRPASELYEIMSRLTSRFEWGLSVDINRPNLEHRILILKKKLQAETSDPDLIPESILDYIASIFDNNVRELEGALKRVLFYCTAFDYKFTIANAEEALKNLINSKNISNKTLESSNFNNVLDIVSSYYNISTSDLLSKKRKKQYVFPRQVSMYILKELFDLTYKKIGQIFNNRDHSTVIYSIEQIANDMQIDSIKKSDIDKLLVKCGKKA
ncbi:MAG: chromosomal replication initiator protein DnaA [Candidatus Izemoplasmatales bacterium]|nr:chromosomal replication initiator protein DnaA [Candidatus Izemoplasmatales bacterium]MDD4354393.1 chromosomal replication initiator protein DnaA [Candidatus Izemoplasmatales bacterium]MDD4987490.1 chromosomal replication initiator protein DnaA [Candidatus Izemoplasmatales bacterium]MDY0372971.1 chromosomal replication initiator protein DnaA [Candidatus Izemoplasmatales bacterium]